jgi:hypothetical protein
MCGAIGIGRAVLRADHSRADRDCLRAGQFGVRIPVGVSAALAGSQVCWLPQMPAGVFSNCSDFPGYLLPKIFYSRQHCLAGGGYTASLSA